MSASINSLDYDGDFDDFDDEDEEDCSFCGGQGWGIVGVDWDTDDGVNGPFDGDVQDCPNCRGSGDAEDMTFW